MTRPTEVLMSIFVLFDVALTLLQGMTNGQIGHLVHVFMPGMIQNLWGMSATRPPPTG